MAFFDTMVLVSHIITLLKWRLIFKTLHRL